MSQAAGCVRGSDRKLGEVDTAATPAGHTHTLLQHSGVDQAVVEAAAQIGALFRDRTAPHTLPPICGQGRGYRLHGAAVSQQETV